MEIKVASKETISTFYKSYTKILELLIHTVFCKLIFYWLNFICSSYFFLPCTSLFIIIFLLYLLEFVFYKFSSVLHKQNGMQANINEYICIMVARLIFLRNSFNNITILPENPWLFSHCLFNTKGVLYFNFYIS